MFCIDCWEEIMDLIYNMIHSTSFENRKPSNQQHMCVYARAVFNKHNLIANFFEPINLNFFHSA